HGGAAAAAGRRVRRGAGGGLGSVGHGSNPSGGGRRPVTSGREAFPASLVAPTDARMLRATASSATPTAPCRGCGRGPSVVVRDGLLGRLAQGVVLVLGADLGVPGADVAGRFREGRRGGRLAGDLRARRDV